MMNQICTTKGKNIAVLSQTMVPSSNPMTTSRKPEAALNQFGRCKTRDSLDYKLTSAEHLLTQLQTSSEEYFMAMTEPPRSN